MVEPWPDPTEFQESLYKALHERFHDDCIEVLERKLNEPISAQNFTEEWVNEAVLDELREANARVENLEAYRRELQQLQRALASPPPPWKVFGYHAQFAPNIPDVIFWGDDGAGLPIWERLVMSRQEMAERIAHIRRVRNGSLDRFGDDPPMSRDYDTADLINSYLKGE